MSVAALFFSFGGILPEMIPSLPERPRALSSNVLPQVAERFCTFSNPKYRYIFRYLDAWSAYLGRLSLIVFFDWISYSIEGERGLIPFLVVRETRFDGRVPIPFVFQYRNWSNVSSRSMTKKTDASEERKEPTLVRTPEWKLEERKPSKSKNSSFSYTPVHSTQNGRRHIEQERHVAEQISGWRDRYHLPSSRPNVVRVLRLF